MKRICAATVALTAAALLASGATAPARAAGVSNDGLFHQLSSARIADSRTGLGLPKATLLAGKTATLKVAGQGGVPTSGVSAVVVSLTAIKASAKGWVTAYPSGTTRPTTSVLNFPAGWTGATTVTLPLGADGSISLYAGSTDVNLAVDVLGWYSDATSTAALGSVFVPSDPERWGDTRSDGFGKLLAGEELYWEFPYPADATDSPSAVQVNITALNAAGGGWLSGVGTDGSTSSTSLVNFAKGETSPVLTVLPVRPTGEVDKAGDPVYAFSFVNGGSNAVDVLTDVQGWYYDDPAAVGLKHVAMTPTRVIDTRSGLGGPKGQLGTGSTRAFTKIAAAYDAERTAAIEGTITAANATSGTYITQWDGMATRPTTSNLNVAKRINRSNGMSTMLGWNDTTQSGEVSAYNGYGSVDLIEDVTGRWDATDAAMNPAAKGTNARTPASTSLERRPAPEKVTVQVRPVR
ncbi:hypothetical protein PZ938_06315 [Luteipulveratus sp. YIM 133132]|uniref:hypothetical protein n=1 Tax=Luteipulveratus flavus TaxID=3031728 RepID=UPI0023B0050A|nr:hypothetical protein [Luteipulveratus sp. YIM 133132]MDE9365215.1 hypothetical protein [Luteipulveratus sp. YIM 133132]